MIDRGILQHFTGASVLVTGGTGLIGRQVVDLLVQAGACVKIVSLDRVAVPDRAEHEYGDLTEFSFCRAICRDMDYVFHIAGIGASVQSAKTRMASHMVPMLQMNTNMLEAARLARAHKVVFTSSVGAYADADVFREADYRLDSRPMDFAGWAKRMAEAQIYAYRMEHGLENFAVVRPPNVYGPGDNFHPDHALVIPALMYRIRRGDDPLVVWGDGSCERDFVYSRDVAEGIILALWHGMPQPPGCINLGSGRAHAIRELVETLNRFIDFRYEFDSSKPTGVRRRLMDITLAREHLGYRPTTSLQEGLRQTWDWFVAHPDEYTRKQCYFEGDAVSGRAVDGQLKKEVGV
jgi:GDP-L-fucose synthase